MVNFPHPRYEYYAETSFKKIKTKYLDFMNPLIRDLGFFNFQKDTELLSGVETFSYAVLFIGLVFDILLVVFVLVACLLIYSLLQISVDTKTFEFGVLRLVGLSKNNFITLILI